MVDYEKSVKKAAVGTIIIVVVVAVVELVMFLVTLIK